MKERSTEAVLLDHLERAQNGDIEGDIAQNFSPSFLLMTTYGTFRGHEGARQAAALLDQQIGPAHYNYLRKLWDGELAFLEWTAETERASVPDGADSYLIREGRIVAMTSHYSVLPRRR